MNRKGIGQNKKQVLRIITDRAMTVLLLLLMGYSLVGETAHEVIGICMFALFITHHILNRKWIRGLSRGRYTPFRIFQTALTALIFIGMCGSAVSGVMLSRHVFRFLGISFGASFARTAHLLCGYWNFVLMSLHLGLHWIVFVRLLSKKLPQGKPAWVWTARAAAALAAGYGVYALIARKLLEYLFGVTFFVFFDAGEPLFLFLLDYLAIMALFVWIGYYVSVLLKNKQIKFLGV